ncbi:UDP-Glycosyltransferase/glycogen phosphorylase [Basidiobolus meristosporus CBS 931.73]|uniref:UDP-Glycosyltransferase/glycogen phosphorylase n=1 Tax=Basidiobolus meristosporus CBS 931.73 TaxID=1314790 RepID=A0A1Y1YQP0_9FUNG|nr:UDP-Glycosyltransferase/glycogen phosphorylase [Basidiobolus meristosporus CBS 931.73]|eukprot:ORY00343.1 UDP-Glycosyltransferase/glycogen phosphorylase [Basidiobolus meristosporus CBS 931.73]
MTLYLKYRQKPIRIDMQQFPAGVYVGIDPKLNYTIPSGTSIYHVTKEFGAVSMGGLGVVVTALAQAQQSDGILKTSVIIPYYSLLKKAYPDEIEPYCEISMGFRDTKNVKHQVKFGVYKFPLKIHPTSASKGRKPLSDAVNVYLIGPGDYYPFNLAFKDVSHVNEIYNSPDPLNQEWKNLYFAKAAARFILYQHTQASGQHRGVDLVQLHGATNAMVTKYLRQYKKEKLLEESAAKVVYTLHDYGDEVQYSLLLSNLRPFLDNSMQTEATSLQPYWRQYRMFPSGMAINMADAVTFVSKTMARDIVEGRCIFPLKELVMDEILRKVRSNRFIGVTNGVDFSTINPFTDRKLLESHNAFPLQKALDDIPNNNAETLQCHRVIDCKRKAKEYLRDRGLLPTKDFDRPIALFIGRFLEDKGCRSFPTAIDAFKANNVRFVIMGQPNQWPTSDILNLQKRNPDDVIVMHEPEPQEKFGVFWRMAADFAYVPSRSESFGLVAAEGLLFGASVISTGVGGLQEFLVDRNDPEQRRHNAYLFDPFNRQSKEFLRDAITDAAHELQTVSQNQDVYENFVWQLINDALNLGWDRAGGPLHQYYGVYQMAMNASMA